MNKEIKNKKTKNSNEVGGYNRDSYKMVNCCYEQQMEKRITKVVLCGKNAAIYNDENYTIEIEDLSGGEFVVVTKPYENAEGEVGGRIEIEPEDWPFLKEAIDEMVKQCR
ncbi:MAG: hypothetical protein GF313_08975 [Caldithrix sp.]|nr:hypothetical protein [Caldithrix sp.]